MKRYLMSMSGLVKRSLLKDRKPYLTIAAVPLDDDVAGGP